MLTILPIFSPNEVGTKTISPTSTNLAKSCELVAMPITGFFIFKNTATVMQCQRSLEKSKDVRTQSYSLAKVMRSLKKS